MKWPPHEESFDRELESLLAAAPLRSPSGKLDARMHRALRGGARVWKTVAACLAVAAALVIGLGTFAILRHRSPAGNPSPQAARVHSPASAQALPSPIAAAPAQHPVRFIRQLSGVANDGIVGSIAGAPVQRIRRTSVQQVVVFDPSRGTYVSYRQPVQQVFLVRGIAF